MTAVPTNLTSGSNTSSNPSSTAAVNPTAGSLTLLWIGYAVEGGGTTVVGQSAAIDGARETWTLLASAYDAAHATNRRGMFLYAGTGAVTNEAISINVSPLGGGTWTETAWIVDEWTGQDETTPYDTPVITGGSTGTSGELGDLGTPGEGDRITAAWIHETDEAVTASGLTALGSVTGGTDLRTLHSFYDASDPQDETPAASWASSSSWGAIGLIINAAAGGASAPKRSLLLGIG